MIQGQLVLVQLGQDGANVQMSVRLDLRSLQSRLDRQSPLKEVQSRSHLANASVVAGHVIEGHGLAEFVVLAQLFALLEQIERAVNILLFEVVDGQNVTDLAKLLASAREFTTCRPKVHLLYLQQLFQDADCFDIFALKFKVKE